MGTTTTANTMLHIVGTFFLFASVVLLVIVSVGTPVWDSIAFLTADIPEELRLGMWGYCLGSDCTAAKLGYSLDNFQNFDNDNLGDLAGTVVSGLTYALILHPIAAGIALIALFFALCNNIVTGILGSLVAFFAFLVALAIDLGLFVTTKSRINDQYGAGTADYSIALWLTLAALVLQLLAACTVCFVSRSNKRRRDREASGARDIEMKNANRASYDNNAGYGNGTTGAPTTGSKLKFWQKNKGYY